MYKTTYLKIGFVILFLLVSVQMFGQLPVPFTPRLPNGSIKVKGDILLIGNNIITAKDLPLPYNGSEINNNNEGVYVNVADGGDSSIFSSSSADLAINNSCKSILYAGLYWASVYPLEIANNRSVQFEGTPRIEDWNQIKFKLPTGGFIDLVADDDSDPVGEEDDIIFDGYEYYGLGVTNSFKDSPIICYKNVTSLLQGLPDADGQYTVANLRATRGIRRGGCSAGWTLVVIYESPILPSKFISVFDGYAGVQNTTELDIPVSGFQTLPSPLPVNSNIAVAALEGDIGLTGDSFQFKASTSGAYTVLSDAINQANNFFNSTITINGIHATNRNPASLNTLGLDINNFRLPNPLNSVLPNNATAGDLKLTTNGDGYGVFLTSFAVEIIEPKITLTKVVEDALGNDIGNQLVNLGDELNYVIGFQNTGNDDATNLIIRDVLPTNIVFNYPTDMGLLPPGVTVQSYNPTIRELIFSVDNSVVEENDPAQEIRFKVAVVSSCSLLSDACSNIISNQAYVTYNGTINSTFIISDDPSFSSNTGCLITPAATNFLADLNCIFSEEVILCGDSTVLTAANGYDSYSWSTSPTGTPVIGTTQSITVTATGTYYVRNTAIAPCQSIEQEFDVITFGAGVTNPVIPFADQVVICPNDGKELPNIFLCGGNGPRLIETNITDTTSIIWEQLDETSCTAITNLDCANEDAACTWNQVTTGPNFMADTAGQFRLTLNYDGGCFNQFYFNVYTNLLAPTVTSRDIYCTTPGEIVVGGVPSGYEYSIDGVNYQTSNVFSVNTPNIYTIYIKQIGVDPNPCIFTVPDVQIRQTDFTVSTIITQPLCYGDLGSVSIAANDVRPQYFFSISQGGTLVNSIGPITPNNYTFSNLNPGTYTIDVSTEDGCVYSGDIDIIEPLLLEATSALTKPLTCTDGEITVYPTGGTPPYFYFVNSTTVFQTTPVIPVANAGIYNIIVVDANNCSAETSITVDAIPAPDFTVNWTDIACSDAGDVGTITINVTNPNGNTLEYSIDNGVTFSNSNIFIALADGNYDVVVQYSSGPDSCLTLPQSVSITTQSIVTGSATLTTPYSCNSNGIITVSGANGGTAPYTYSLDGLNFLPGTTFTGLTDGTYTVTIRDSGGCTFIAAPITITALNPPTDLDFSNTALSCPAITSEVTITGTTGGTLPLEYQIITPVGSATAYQTSNIFPGLSPDTYTFQVRDAYGCTYSETFTIAPLPPITVSTVITKDLDCTASPDGIITGNISGGTAPFTYAVSFNGGAYSGSNSVTGTSFAHTATSDGTYQFQITDANSCIADSGVQTINAISLPEIISVTQTQPILCHGDNNAAIDITINNAVGTPPFIINVNNDTTATDYGTQTSGLPAGDYTITLTDANLCVDTDTITITEPNAIDFTLAKVDITCNTPGGSSLGAITIQNVTGGTAPFTYYITNNFGDVIAGNPYSAVSNEDHTFNIINFGTYTINIVDANGCSFSRQEIIASPPSDLLIDVTTVVPNCTTGGTAVVEAISIVGSGNYEFGILEFNSAPYTSTFLPSDVGFPNQRTFTNLTPGVIYTFVVHDLTTGCYFVKSADASIAPASTLTSSVIPNNVICQGENNGSVTFTIDNFDSTTTSVDYEIFTAFTNVLVDGPSNVAVTFGTPETVTTPAPGTLSPGQYYIRFTENGTGSFNGCESASVIFEIRESAVALSVTATVDKDANCNPNSGIISAIATNGTPPYLYQLTTSATPPLATDPLWASANTFNADANSYYVHILDAYGCIQSTPIIVLPSDPEPIITATLSNQCTVTEGNFAIDVVLTSASIAPYSYSVDGGAFQTRIVPFTISNLSSGTHTVEVQDANGCGNLVSVDIESPLEIIPAITALPTCNDNDGQITITGSGGSGTYAYSISPNPASITLAGNVFSGVPFGTFVVTITDTVTSCSENVTVVLPGAVPPTFTTTSTPVTCFSDNDGTFELNVNGYSGAYTYEVFDSSSVSVFGMVPANTSTNPELVTGLLAGTYSVVITETASPFCSATSSVIISSPSDPLNLIALETSNVTCDDDKGTIIATASGGWGSYEYELTGTATVAYSSNGTFTNLSAGAYTINVRDAGGCIVSENVPLNLPTPIDATISATPSLLSCFGDSNANITVSAVTGGQGTNYTYTLNRVAPTVSASGPQTSPIFNGLGIGTYNVVVTDGYNCEFTTANVVITQPTEVEANLVKATSQTCTTQTTLTLSASGGTDPYEYSDTASFTTVLGTFVTSVTFPVTTGTYRYYVRDANSCSANVSNDITIDPLPTLTVSLDTTNAVINCAGDDNGVIIASAEGGLGSYVYTLQDASGNPIAPVTQTSPGVFTNLPVGNYQVQVDSGDCLEISAVAPITNAAVPLDVTFNPIDVTCNGENDGMLEITTSGGSGTVKYAISPQLDQFFDVETVENLALGNYDIVVQDELGCYVTYNFDIDQPLPLGFTYTITSEAPCDGDSTGEFTIEILGGEPPYSVSLDDVTYTQLPLGTTTYTFSGLEGGEKMVYVLDSGNCGGDSPFSIPLAEPVILDPLANIDFECINDFTNNTNTVTNRVTVTVDSSITDTSVLEYSLDGAPFATGTGIYENLTAGPHSIAVRHPNGCVQITDNGIPFVIDTFQPLALVLDDGGLNEIVATSSGGAAPYEFRLNDGSYGDENTFLIFESGDYRVTVIDANGCEVSATRFFEYVDVCIPNYFTPNDDNVLDEWGPGCADQYQNLTFDIFDRYGRKIATLRIGDKWDGKYKGVELPSGDYWYVVKLNEPQDKREFVGHFTLYR
ncbi:MAG: T9SS type B sorting domain-containing protein [Algibacter sp.]|uniref:T9SS type B sorting domain-containing protein n=1 Tax=Algibacter sp. TaxID=1872428 RepID=UPI00261492DB|nr:T9SS type B sorting domain-containing protein [Algibacter sp.]MDG1730455.1 T9SS type B sorting domain-containing protein [Algibacter sp.]MDG2177373.1 T9SS type B sorting domain-containing protein [Algibacter sp.]